MLYFAILRYVISSYYTDCSLSYNYSCYHASGERNRAFYRTRIWWFWKVWTERTRKNPPYSYYSSHCWICASFPHIILYILDRVSEILFFLHESEPISSSYHLDRWNHLYTYTASSYRGIYLWMMIGNRNPWMKHQYLTRMTESRDTQSHAIFSE